MRVVEQVEYDLPKQHLIPRIKRESEARLLRVLRLDATGNGRDQPKYRIKHGCRSSFAQ